MPAKDHTPVFLWIIAAIVAWNSWMSMQVISMRSEIQAALLTHNNVIPPVIESSISEIRTRLNNDQTERLKLMEAAIENRGDIGRLKRDVEAIKGTKLNGS